jgi:glutathione S-transferase
MKPELISFKLCPFVQRSLIVLLEKEADYDITYVNPADPPEWFAEVSPLGKVPVLKVGDAVLFESAVIMEYLDEVNPPSLQPADPLEKAQNRAWVEFCSDLLFRQYRMSMAADEATFEKERAGLRTELERLEKQVTGPYFNGSEFRLVDAAFAPFFLRIDLLEQWHPTGLLDGLPVLAEWQQALLARKSTRNAVPEGFEQMLRGYIGSQEGFGAKAYGG